MLKLDIFPHIFPKPYFERMKKIAEANPALSANPADYILVNFRFRGGVFNDAELGMSIQSLKLDIF